ncbi:germination lipoprotein GerS-related protein [Clostridium sp. Ade.TY]|uniref:germination lipoprotein GerS-related protein n=1 Tax=Clostridium sp. Ade.TY TaxID=1391647 RepID=UPI0004093EA7|nr:germination lipoprotein GerS-related protein [Clostridium sp. Ade.TY]
MKVLDKIKNISIKKENKNKSNDNNLKKKLLVTVLMIIPFVSIILIISLRHVITPTNEDILNSVKNLDDYTSIVEYKITNDNGTYNQKAELSYCKDNGIRLDFGEELTKIYSDEKITMIYNKTDEKYEVDRELDRVYDLAAMKELFKNPILEFKEGQEEWGDLKYLKVEFDLITKNIHIDRATLYIDKNKKEPMLLKVYDSNSKERIKIEYREFLKKKFCEKEKFKK